MALFPAASSIKASFDPNGSRSSSYWINSTLDDAKNKAVELSHEAEAELKKVGQAIKSETKGIKLYSPEFYAACTLGGIVGMFLSHQLPSYFTF